MYVKMDNLNEFLARTYYNSEINNDVYSPRSEKNAINLYRYLTDDILNRFSTLLSVCDTQCIFLQTIYKLILERFESHIPVGKLIVDYVGHWLPLDEYSDEFVYYAETATNVPKNDAAIITSMLRFYETLITKLTYLRINYRMENSYFVIMHDSKICRICEQINGIPTFLNDGESTDYRDLHRPGIIEYMLFTDSVEDDLWLKRKNGLVGKFVVYRLPTYKFE